MKDRSFSIPQRAVRPLLAALAAFGALCTLLLALAAGPVPLWAGLLILSLLLSLGLGLHLCAQARRLREASLWLSDNRLSDYLFSGRREPAAVPESFRPWVEPLTRQWDRERTSQQLSARAAFSALQSQINPHFLYNTLDAIRSQAIVIGAQEIADMTERLSRFFRYSIGNTGSLVTVDDELRNVADYIAIQQYRFEDRFALQVELEEDRLFCCYLPKMTLQPIVENAVYHGIEKKTGKGGIAIRIFTTGPILRILIADDGVGIPAERVLAMRAALAEPIPEGPRGAEQFKSRSGIALSNIHQRLRLLFGGEYGIELSSVEGMGTDVEIVLPAIDDANRAQYHI